MRNRYQVHVALPKTDVEIENSTGPSSDNKKQRMHLKRKQPDSRPKYVPTKDKCAVKHTSEVPANTLQSPSCEDEVVIVCAATSDHTPAKGLKRNSDKEEMSPISKGKMPTDTSINCAQNIIHQAFPFIQVFEDTTLFPNLFFSAYGGEFAQILHDGNLYTGYVFPMLGVERV